MKDAVAMRSQNSMSYEDRAEFRRRKIALLAWAGAARADCSNVIELIEVLSQYPRRASALVE